MTHHLGLVVARVHGVLACRPGSRVFHVYVGPRSRRSGRVPRGARPVGQCRTRRLYELERVGSVLDLGGRRMCGRCSARLSSLARRAAQPPVNAEQRKVFWESAGVTSVDLVTALALAASVEETHALAVVTNTLFGPINTTPPFRRPTAPGKAQGRWDFEKALLARRDQLRAAERTPEEVEAARQARENDLHDRALREAARRNDARIARAVERRDSVKWLMPAERALLTG